MSTPERRLTPTERLHEVTLAFANRSAAPPEHSIEVSRNAKGVMQFTVTVRGGDLDNCAVDAQRIAHELENRWPYPETNGGSE